MKQSLSYLQVVCSSANILKFLVQDLLDLMNIKQQSFTTDMKKFSAIDACREIMKCYEMQATQKNLFLEL